MNRDQIFDIWCPASARWSPWVKPVLFSAMSSTTMLPPATGIRALNALPPGGSEAGLPPAWDTNGLPAASESVAMIFDLPGGEAVRLAMTFLPAFRPVPLYNALPWVEGSGFLLANDHPPVVNMVDVVEALRVATPELAKAQVPKDAPPIFLLDANRRRAMGPALPGSFDNRSICFPTDFPSANFLLGNGIGRVILVLRQNERPESDLAHTLRQWQDAGVRIELKRLDAPEPPRVLEVTKPSLYRWLLYRAGELLSFKRSALGGFGGVLPEPSSG